MAGEEEAAGTAVEVVLLDEVADISDEMTTDATTTKTMLLHMGNNRRAISRAIQMA
jgi:hypothetical protein